MYHFSIFARFAMFWCECGLGPRPKEAPAEGEREEGPRRDAKWLYATFNIVTTMVGAGVLSLPYAMAYLGWGPGMAVMVISGCLTLHTFWLLTQLHESSDGVRYDRYIDLARHAFGQKVGPWIVLSQQLIVRVGVNIVYMVAGGTCFQKFMEITDGIRLKHSYWIIISGSTHFFLSQFRINSTPVSGVPLVAVVMSLCYSTIAWVGCLSNGKQQDVSYAYKKTSGADSIFRLFNALGQISFAYAAHAVALEIQATIPSIPGKPSKVAMWKGVMGAYFVIAICYFPVAIIGYWAFGQDVTDNVLVALQKPSWLIVTANFMAAVHVHGRYQIFAMPLIDLMENGLLNKLNVPAGLPLRLVVRTTYVAFTLFMAATFPFFGDLLGFFGGFGLAPTSYFLPSIIWLILKKPKRFSTQWIINWVRIFVGVFIMLASAIGGFMSIIADSLSYGFYQ